MLSPNDAREAYQSAIPNRRDKYRHAAHQVGRDGAFLAETMRVAKEEPRLRLRMAADRVKQVIDSGWTPQGGRSVASVYRDMFAGYTNANRNSFDDLYGVINSAMDNVGVVSRTEHQRLYSLEFSQYQVDVSTEFIHDLEFYRASKHPNNGNVTNLRVQGDIALLQTGGVSHITQNIGLQSGEVIAALESLKQAVNSTAQPHISALNELLDESIIEAQKPNARWEFIKRRFDGFQNLVRTAGAVPSAYSLLAGLAAGHGVHLAPLPTSAP